MHFASIQYKFVLSLVSTIQTLYCQYNKHVLSTSNTNTLVTYPFLADLENKPGEQLNMVKTNKRSKVGLCYLAVKAKVIQITSCDGRWLKCFLNGCLSLETNCVGRELT